MKSVNKEEKLLSFRIYCKENDSVWWGDTISINLNSEVFLKITNKQVRSLSLAEMNEAIKNFVRIEFHYLQWYDEYIDFIQLEYSLKVIILWDRYNKNEPIIDGLDFTVLRNVLNKFNTRNLLNFFSQRSNAYLFVHYFEYYADKDAKNQNDVEYVKLLEELQTLYDEADKYVKLQLDEFLTAKKNREEKLDFPILEEYSLFDN